MNLLSTNNMKKFKEKFKMEPTAMAKQIFNFQKKAINTTLDTIFQIQDQTEEYSGTILKNSSLPAESRKMMKKK